MKTIVAYESWFGNTRRLAEVVAGVLSAVGEVQVVSVDDPMPSILHVDLIVIGAPTHVHGLSNKPSREGAIQQRGGIGEVGIGARGWLEQLPLCGGPRVAVFDTRAHKPELFVGSAAHKMATRLQRRGYKLAIEPQSFFIEGTPGPLEKGELEHAVEWGKALANEVMAAAA
jgi:hypothetical protein